jgi:hypothetical protein
MPVPARVVIIPPESTIRMRFSVAIRRFPPESIAMPFGQFRLALVAGPPSPVVA